MKKRNVSSFFNKNENCKFAKSDSLLVIFFGMILIGMIGFVAAEINTTHPICISEGEKGYSIPQSVGDEADVCCSGLVKTGNSVSSSSDASVCLAPTDGSFICSKCGNGVCGLGENKCNCPKDCANTTVPICTDSDGGKNYFVKGSTVEGGDAISVDNCNGNILLEQYCDGLRSKIEEYNCPNGCSNGACLQNVIVTPACTKVCKNIGTKSEGWYDLCTGKLISYESCSGTSSPGDVDMDSCLNNQNNYWDQESDSCKGGYNKEIIKKLCSDSDGGKNIYEQSHTFGFRSYSSSSDPSRDLRIRTGGKDGCISDKQMVENYCDENGFIQTAYLDCSNGCKDGACIKGEAINEKITCKFEGTNKEQECYLAGQFGPEDLGTKFCKADSGSGSCVISYLGYNGEQVTWKSSCGQLQYTTQDGTDEVIYFKCSEGETTTTEIKNKGFRYAKWQCYDGFENKAGDGNSCYLSESFARKAKEDCMQHCNGDNSKCGANSFSVNVECYLDETMTSSSSGGSDEGVLTTVTSGTSEDISTISEKALICKDSCPLDGKCYPFGYRKSGEYCTDKGSFESQLKADSTCDNNFECSSNVCVSGKCISEGFLKKIMNWFSKMFGKE